MMHHEFLLRSLEPFVTVRQWVVLRDTNKTMNTLCARVQSRIKQEDWIVLNIFMDLCIWPHVKDQMLYIDFPGTYDYGIMGFIGWNNHEADYSLTHDAFPTDYCRGKIGYRDYCRKLKEHSKMIYRTDQLMTGLNLASYYHEHFPQHITDHSSRQRIVKIGNICVSGDVTTRSVAVNTLVCKGHGLEHHSTMIEISFKTLRLILSQKKSREK